MLLLASVLVISSFTAQGDETWNLDVVNGKLKASPDFVYNTPLACSRALVKALNEGFTAGCYGVDASGYVMDYEPLTNVSISHGGYRTDRQPDSVIELRLRKEVPLDAE